MTACLEDMTTYLYPHRKSWARDGRTWFMIRQGMEERYQTDYWMCCDNEGIDLESVQSVLGAT